MLVVLRILLALVGVWQIINALMWAFVPEQTTWLNDVSLIPVSGGVLLGMHFEYGFALLLNLFRPRNLAFALSATSCILMLFIHQIVLFLVGPDPFGLTIFGIDLLVGFCLLVEWLSTISPRGSPENRAS